MLRDTGIVVIAKNEGERLERCLDSLAGTAELIVYADSGSTDGSVEAARARGAVVVELDTSRPCNAARGRNAGFARLRELAPELAYVFFLDGDCLLVEGFLERARAELEADPGLVAVCGRRRELAPDDSIYNRLVDTEWNTPVGETVAAGGDVLVRIAALAEVGGYNESMSCGEDPEMCLRLREHGGRIRRIEADMTRHDVALLRLGAWWSRHARGGYAYAHGASLHLHGPEWYNLRTCLSILLWGAALPALAVVPAPFTGGTSLLFGAAYAWLALRVARYRRGLGDTPAHAFTYGAFVSLGKIAEAWGVLRCVATILRASEAPVVEYKDYQRDRAA